MQTNVCLQSLIHFYVLQKNTDRLPTDMICWHSNAHMCSICVSIRPVASILFIMVIIGSLVTALIKQKHVSCPQVDRIHVSFTRDAHRRSDLLLLDHCRYATLRVWTDHDEPTYRLGLLARAMINYCGPGSMFLHDLHCNSTPRHTIRI